MTWEIYLDVVSPPSICSTRSTGCAPRRCCATSCRVFTSRRQSGYRGYLSGRSLLSRSRAEIEVLEKTLREEFLSALCETLEACLQYRNVKAVDGEASDLLLQLFEVKRAASETIPEETD